VAESALDQGRCPPRTGLRWRLRLTDAGQSRAAARSTKPARGRSMVCGRNGIARRRHP
jgi:hypothetical protein